MIKKSLMALALMVTLSQPLKASVPTAAHTFHTNVTMIDMTDEQEDKVREAEEKIKRVIASEAFRAAILNHTVNGKKTFIDNLGLTNSQIYTRILQGAELKYTSKNNTMDMGIKLYFEDSNVVGFTKPSLTYINCNTKFFDRYTASQVAHNMMHEWMHKLGFDHDVKNTPTRKDSVPYVIGDIVNKLAPRF